jgi:hypothetical protein
VGVIVLVALSLRQIWRSQGRRPLRMTSAAGCVLLVAAGGNLYVESSGRTLGFMHSMSARYRLARVAFLFSPVVDPREVIRRFNYPAPEKAVERATRLHALGLLQPPLVQSANIAPLRAEALEEPGRAGAWEELTPGEGEMMRATGWAILPGQGKPADAVLLAYETPEQEWTAFALSNAVTRRRDVVRKTRNRDLMFSGWTAEFPPAAIPPGARISAWAVSAEGPTLQRLQDRDEAVDAVTP